MTRAGRLLIAAVSAGACAPLTYSDPGVVDFETYGSVRVSVTSSLDSVRATDYFVEELRAVSGFSHVTVDPAETVNAVLGVVVSAKLESTTNEDGSVNSQYSSEANYRLSAPSDANVDSGTTSDQSEFEEESIEDALDQVAAHYIRPYRL